MAEQHMPTDFIKEGPACVAALLARATSAYSHTLPKDEIDRDTEFYTQLLNPLPPGDPLYVAGTYWHDGPHHTHRAHKAGISCDALSARGAVFRARYALHRGHPAARLAWRVCDLYYALSGLKQIDRFIGKGNPRLLLPPVCTVPYFLYFDCPILKSFWIVVELRQETRGVVERVSRSSFFLSEISSIPNYSPSITELQVPC